MSQQPGPERIAVAREEIEVGKRSSVSDVVIRIVPSVREQAVEVALEEQRIEIERVPKNEFVQAPSAPRTEGDLTIVPVYEEVVVIEKRLMLREEVHIRLVRSTRTQTRQMPLRSEDVQVLRSTPHPLDEPSPAAAGTRLAPLSTPQEHEKRGTAMADKLIGFFDNKERADQVYDDLVEAGFDRNDVHIYEGKDEPGLWDRVKEWFGYADEEDRNLYHEAARRGGVAVVADLRDEDSPGSPKAMQIFERHNPIDLDMRAEQWRSEGSYGRAGYTHGYGTATDATQEQGGYVSESQSPSAEKGAFATPSASAGQGEQNIPLAREEVQIGKRARIQGGVRIHSHVTSTPIEKEVTLRDEHVEVERRPVDREVAANDMAFEERTIEATEIREEPEVHKRAKVVEEVSLRKDVRERSETVRENVRQTKVDVENLSGEGQRAGGRGEAEKRRSPDDVGARGSASPEQGTGDEIHSASMATSGMESEFEPTDYVEGISSQEQYRNRDWASCETDLRSDFERRYPNRRWEDVKQRIRTAYEQRRQRA